MLSAKIGKRVNSCSASKLYFQVMELDISRTACSNHVNRMAQESCHACGRAFCADCLEEGAAYFYCHAPGCLEALYREILPKRVLCPDCESELELTPYEQREMKYTCPVCGNIIDHSSAPDCSPSSRRNWSWVYLAAAGVVVLIGVAGGYGQREIQTPVMILLIYCLFSLRKRKVASCLGVDPSLCFIKAGLKAKCGAFTDAEKCYTRCAQKEHRTIDSLYARAMVRGHLRNYQGALEDLDKILAMDIKQFRVHTARGAALNNLGRTAEAESAYSSAIFYEPDNARAYRGRAVARIFLGRASEALRDLDIAVSANPTDIETLLIRAKLYLDLGNRVRALRDVTVVLDLCPGHTTGLAIKHKAQGGQ